MRPRRNSLTRAQRRYAQDMERRLQALDRDDARAKAAGLDPYELWMRDRDQRAPEFRKPPRVRRPLRRRLRNALIVIVAIALPIGAVVLMSTGSSGSRQQAGSAGQYPPAGHEAADEPLGTPQPAPSRPGTFQFVATQSGTSEPVTWDPCRPIHYATNGIAPVEGQELLASAFKRLRTVTGFRFVNDGPTSEQPSFSRQPYQPDRYGDRWAPVLVAWTTPAQIPKLSGSVIGVGGGISVSNRSARHTYVSGILFLDRPQVTAQLADASRGGLSVTRRAQLRAVMLHELGHLFGLGHVDDPAQLMYPEARLAVTDYASGDLHGLHALATGPCAPHL